MKKERNVNTTLIKQYSIFSTDVCVLLQVSVWADGNLMLMWTHWFDSV